MQQVCVDYPTIPLSCYPQIPTLFLVLFLKYHVPARKMARSVPQLFAKGIYGNLMKLYLFVQWKKHWLNHLQRKNWGSFIHFIPYPRVAMLQGTSSSSSSGFKTCLLECTCRRHLIKQPWRACKTRETQTPIFYDFLSCPMILQMTFQDVLIFLMCYMFTKSLEGSKSLKFTCVKIFHLGPCPYFSQIVLGCEVLRKFRNKVISIR